jgi:hypothetical protein
MSQEEKAAQYIKDAEKKLGKTGFMAMLSGGNKNEEAADLYAKAANCYKMAKKCMARALRLGCRQQFFT